MFPETSRLCTDRIFEPGHGVTTNDQLEAPPAPIVRPATPVMFEPLKRFVVEKITFASPVTLGLTLVDSALVAVPAKTGALVRALGAGDDMEIPGESTDKTVTALVKAPQMLLMRSV